MTTELIETRLYEENASEREFLITLQVKAKHAVMLAAARKIGSIRKLAEYLGVTYALVCRWIALDSVPNFESEKSKIWSDSNRRSEIERKLMELTGKTLDEIFPEAIRSEDFLSLDKSREVTQSVDLKQLAIGQAERMLLPSPDGEVEKHEQAEIVEDSLRYLTHREREVIKLRFGMFGSDSMTYEDIGRVMKITRERVRQIESKAMRKLSERIRKETTLGWNYQFSCHTCDLNWIDVCDDVSNCAKCGRQRHGRRVPIDKTEVA